MRLAFRAVLGWAEPASPLYFIHRSWDVAPKGG